MRPDREIISAADIPDEYKTYPNFVCWRWEENSQGEWRKVNYRASNPTVRAYLGQPKDWVTFDVAYGAYVAHNFDGIEFFQAPMALKVKPENIPAEMKQHQNWVVWKWRLLFDKRKQVWTWKKIPYSPIDLNKQAASTRPEEWGSFDETYEIYMASPNKYDGIWFSLAGLYAGIDFDLVVNANADKLASIREAAKRFNCFTEISPSGTGMHMIVIADLLPNYQNKNSLLDFEIYKDARFLSVTGHVITGITTVEERQAEVNWFHANYFPPRQKTTYTLASGSSDLSDIQILEKLMTARNAARFKKLWNGGCSDYNGDQSSADYHFVRMIGFYTSDPTQILRLVRRSKLMRDKWNRKDYAERTINRALGSITTRWKG